VRKRHDKRQAGFRQPMKFSEAHHDALFILIHDAGRACDGNQRENHEHDKKNGDKCSSSIHTVHPTLRVTPSTDKTLISAPGSSTAPSCYANSARHSSEPIFTRPQPRGAIRFVPTPVRPITGSTFEG